MIRHIQFRFSLSLAAVMVVFVASSSPAEDSSWSGGGPDVAWVTALARRGPAEPIYAGTYGGGVFVSTDGGLNWEDFSNDELAGTVVWELEPAVGQTGPVIYAATEFSGLFRWQQSNGLWGGLNNGLGPAGILGIRAVEAHGSQGNLLSVASSRGMWTSHNYGFAWPDSNRWLAGSTFEDVEVSPRAPNTIFGLESFSLFRTVDKGATRVDLGAGLPQSFNRDLELFDGSLDTLLVVTLQDGLFLSTGGMPFQRIGPNPNPLAAIRSYDLEIEESSGTLLLGTERGLHVSPDLGQSWTKFNGRSATVNLPEIWSILELNDDPTELLLGSFRYGVLRTGSALDDWTEQSSGLRAAWVKAVEFWPGNVLAATAHGRLYRSTDGALSWVDATGDLDAIQQNDVHRVASTGRWIVTTNQGLWLSDDEGTTWARPSISPTVSLTRDVLHAPWDPEETLYLTSSLGVWKSEDAGDNWLLADDGLPDNGSYLCSGYAEGDQSLFFAVNGDAIYRSVAGSNYIPLPNSAFGGRSFRTLAFPTGTGDLIAVGGSGQLSLWQIEADGNVLLRMNMEIGLPVEPGDSGVDVESLAYDAAEACIYVGLAGSGIWRSFDLGKSWLEFNEGIRVQRVTDLKFDAAQRRLYVATFGSGVYGRTLGSGLTSSAKATMSLRLQAANPAQSETTFLLELPIASHVRADVIDIRGRRVRGILNRSLPAGSHDISWDLRDERDAAVANGVYWLRVSDGRGEVARALTVAR